MKLRFALQIALITSCAFAFSACSPSPPNDAPASSGPVPGPSESREASTPAGDRAGFGRPSLVVKTGKYFTYAMPADWKSTETANGVDMTSPDGMMTANSALLVGNQGKSDPWTFVSSMLTVLGNHQIQQVTKKDLPPQRSGYPGINWEIQEFEVNFMDPRGTARHSNCTCGICNAYGSYSAIIQIFATKSEEYDENKTWLPLLAQSVKAIDPGKIAYQNDVLPVRNHPLDNSALMASWKEKNLSQDRISKAQQEGMMGYERMVSSSGQHYNMPLETYDGTVGGYRNPEHPEEVLKSARPGE